MTLTPEERRGHKRMCDRRYYMGHREEARAYQVAWREAHPGATTEQHRKWRQNNPGRFSANQKRWRQENPTYARDRYHADENVRTRELLRQSVRQALIKRLSGRDWKCTAKIGALLGCSKPDLIAHLAAQFQPGMSWSNYGRGGWEVDHIRPCASFDLTDPEQQRACFHFTNLRPLWRADNLTRPKGRA